MQRPCRACIKHPLPPHPRCKILPTVPMPASRCQSSALQSATRDLQHHYNRKSHPNYCSTNSRIPLFDPSRRDPLGGPRRRTRHVSGSATSSSFVPADSSAVVVVTGRRMISDDHGGRENRSGSSWGCCYNWGFDWWLGAGGARRRVVGRGTRRRSVGNGKLGRVVRIAVSIVSCGNLSRAEKQVTHDPCMIESTYVPDAIVFGVQM